MILDLKDKVKGRDAEAFSEVSDGQSKISMGSSEKQDAIDALLALGYSRGESIKVVMETALPGMDAGQVIKSALRKLTKG
jgi:Holliday junction DNA helicase RuvA